VELWVDAQLAPGIATWLSAVFCVTARALRELGLRDARDRDIFLAARAAGATVLTKDADFVRLLEQLGPPPAVLWLTLGNTSNERLRSVLAHHWPRIRLALDAGEALVEITDQ